MKTWTRFAMLFVPAALMSGGCGQPNTPPMSAAPPIASGQYNNPGQMGGQQPGSAGTYQWQDVPVGQQVPITRAVFDQGGYQIYASSGETIVVPFVNQNLYAMKFGQTSGSPYFVNTGSAPVLYLSPGMALENAAAQGARWYPFSQGFNYSQPVYVGIAPTWNDFTGMGWYPGMNYYGGMWGVNPYHASWMPGFYISIGGHRYTDYGGYRSYYTTHTNYVPFRSSFNYGTRSTGSFGTGRSTGRTGFGTSSNSTGSFRAGRTSTGFGTTPPGRSSTGFGTTSSGRSSFGSGGSMSGPGSAMGGRSSFGGGGSMGTTSPGSSGTSSTTGRSSFGGGNSGVSNTPRSSGGSFSGGRSSSGGSSFGGGSRSSFGGGSRRR